MLNQATIDMLTGMKMSVMTLEFENQLKDASFSELGFGERLRLLVPPNGTAAKTTNWTGVSVTLSCRPFRFIRRH